MMQTIENSIDITRIKGQREFIYSTARYACLSGGYRSGKTFAALIKVVLLLQLAPRNTAFIGRLDAKDLRLTTIQDLFRILPADWIESHNKQEGLIVLKNGSKIIYSDLKDIAGKKGGSYGVVFIDQIEECGSEIFDFFVARLSSTSSGKQYFICTCNPRGHDWVYYKFKAEESRLKDSVLFEFTPFGNPYLPAGYVDSLLNSGMSQSWINTFVYGSFDENELGVYPTFDSKVHMIEPFAVPAIWPLYETLDHGCVSPTACYQIALDNDENIFVAAEHYKGGESVGYHAACIKNMRSRPPNCTYLDPTAFAKNQSDGRRTYSIADVYADHGIYCVRYQNDWASGYANMQRALAIDPLHRHPITKALGAPRLYIFSTCVNLLREFTTYSWKQVRSKITGKLEMTDEPQDYDDHGLDCVRGFVNSKPAGWQPAAPLPRKPQRSWWDSEETADRYSYMLT